MRKNHSALIALAALTALSTSAFFTTDSKAQEAASQLRSQPAETEPLVFKRVKPSRPTPRTELKAATQAPTPGLALKGPTTKGPDTPSQLANLVVIPYYNNPDSLPEGFPTHSYCVKKPTGGTPNQIKFYIRNAGGTDSGSFQWTPSFPNAGAAPATVIANIPANGQVLITQGIPNGCYTPGFSGVCQFSLHLDDHDEVEEWSEANSYSSYCVSPAG